MAGKEFRLCDEQLVFNVTHGAVVMTSSLIRTGNKEYDAAIDGLEAILLAFASKGLLASKEAVESAINDALEAISNHLG